jgi:4-amino-4-deoxy-L-arabinose transferase-like glycosyltransferase
MMVLVASIAALAALGAALARAAAVAGESRATRVVRGAVLAFAALVVIETVLGVAGVLTAGHTLAALAAAAAVAVARSGRRRAPVEDSSAALPADTPRAAAATAALAAAIVAVLAFRLWAGLHKTTFLYDTLSYHLHVPATWMHDRRLEIVPAVFGDPAPAYAPANLELWFLFLMAPLRSDVLASIGQLPFAALAALAIAAAVREAGGGRRAALAAGLAFLLVPEVWQQAPTAMVDLGLAALLLASVPFAYRLRRAAARADLVAAGAALGLAVGTKHVGALLALPFAAAVGLAASRRGARRRDGAVAFGVAAAAGGFWYARNLLVTGNPFYPVAAFGFTGLYDGRTMRAWEYHLPIGDLGALGAMLLAAGAGFVTATAVGLARARRGGEALVALALVGLFWIAVPYQESRFLLPAFGVAAIAMGRVADRPPPLLGWGALAAATGGALVEALLGGAAPERWVIVPAAAAGPIAVAAWRRIARSGPLARPRARRAGAALLAVGLAALAAFGAGRLAARDPGYAVGDDLDDAWRWFRANVHDARVAYTGTNLAFPLAGERLSNDVRYVNVAGAPAARLHDFPPGAAATTAEPAPYRDGARFDVWLANLRAARAEVLFVAAMYPIVRRNVAADADGFPVERAWADAHPALFTLHYAGAAARVYAIAPAGGEAP